MEVGDQSTSSSRSMEVSQPEQSESPTAKDLANESGYGRGRFHDEQQSLMFVVPTCPVWRRD